MKKYSMLVIFALLLTVGLLPVSAQAGALTNGSAPAGATYATQLFGTGSDATKVPTAGATAVFTFGAAVPAGSVFNVTFTLDKGTWGTALTATSLAVSGFTAGSKTLTSGGGITDSTVIFQISNTDAIDPTTDTLTLTYDVDSLSSLSTAGTAKLSIELKYVPYGTNVDTATALTIITSSTGVTNSVTADTAEVNIDVSAHSALFTGDGALDFSAVGAGTKNAVKLGTTDSLLASAKQKDGATAWNVLVGTGDQAAVVTLTLTGKLAAAKNVALGGGTTVTGGVFIDFENASGSDIGYSSGDAATINTAGTSAIWTLTQAQLAKLQAGARNIYMVVDGTTAVDAMTPNFCLDINYTTTTYKDDQKCGDLKALAKNGTTLVSPWITKTATGYTSRFVLTNSGSSAAQFTVSATGANVKAKYRGTLATLPSIPAGKQLLIPVEDIVSWISGLNQAAVKFEFLAPAGDVQAVYQYFNTTTGLMENIVMNPPHGSTTN